MPNLLKRQEEYTKRLGLSESPEETNNLLALIDNISKQISEALESDDTTANKMYD
jgi:hypothetical protein